MALAATLELTLARWRRGAFLVAAIGAMALAIGAAVDPSQFLRSYLVGWLFWLGVALGCFAIFALHQITGGRWGVPIRPLLESAARTLPLLALLFVPLTIGVRRLYPWAASDSTLLAANPHQQWWYSLPFFFARAAVYFAAWIGCALLLVARHRRHRANPTVVSERRVRALAGPALLVYGLTVTFAAIDWSMSLEPKWNSTIYGVILLVGQVLSALAFVVVASAGLRRHAPFSEATPQHSHDLGNLTLSFVLLWSYTAFSQFLIVWSGNVPAEATWYVRRLGGSWQTLALVLLLGHFAVPFLVLLSRKAKRDGRVLAIVGVGLLVMRLADLEWWVAPAFRANALVHWLDVVAPLAIGGLWLAVWLRDLARGMQRS